jgi:hypothetical protein
MKGHRALAGIVVAMAFLGATASTAVAMAPAPAPALLAGVTRVRDELALLGQAAGPLGLPHRRSVSELELTNRDGYTIEVVAFGQTVALTVSRGHERLLGRSVKRVLATTYVAHGKVTATSIRASFADRGRIAVRLRPGGSPLQETLQAGCDKARHGAIGRFGFFVGELRFRGEDGFTSVEVHRVRGGSIDLAALAACVAESSRPRRHALLPAPRSPLQLLASGAVGSEGGLRPKTTGVRTHPSRRPKPTTLIADDKLPLSRTVFGAQLRGEGRSRFVALDARSEGSIGIIRVATARGPQSAFTFDDPLAFAAVAPPAPFSGNGAFKQGFGSGKSWTGSLAVSLLGAPNFPLTGSPFRTQLVQGW